MRLSELLAAVTQAFPRCERAFQARVITAMLYARRYHGV